MCRKIIAEGELDNGNGQADVHAKVRRLPNYDFRFIGRLQLQRNTKQGIERGMFLHKNFDYPEKPLKYKHIRRISD
mgnify:CR=1 FL=1